MFSRFAFSTTAQDTSSIRVNRFKTGIFLNPHYQKRDKGGEDAAAITKNLIAVADGVGGWAESGIDPAIYSRKLCSNIQMLAERDDVRYIVNPTELLIEAVGLNHEIGSSTCVLVSLDKEAPVLYTSNLGDSGYLLLRKSGLDLVSIFRTTE